MQRQSQPMPLAQAMSQSRTKMPTDRRQADRASVTLSADDRQVVNGVFEQLQAIFPAWRRAFPTDEALSASKREYAKALIEAGITGIEQIKVGMQVARQQSEPWFPSPGQFIKWCELTPEAMGLPSVDQALADVLNHRKTHPAAVIAYKRTSWERGTQTSDQYRKAFEYVYLQLMRRVMAGEDLEAELVKALPTKEQIRHSPEFYHQAAQKGLEQVRAVMRGKRHG